MFVHIKVPAFLKDIFPQTLSVIRKTWMPLSGWQIF